MEIPEKHWMHKTQDEDVQKKYTTQHVLYTAMRLQKQIT